MSTKITFFPVGNGDMTLISLDDDRKTTILIDVNIRSSADNQDDDTFDAANAIKSRLQRNGAGQLYVNVFIQTHPDQDHLGGLRNHFHLGPPENLKNKALILINEIWSSPIVWRRADKRTGHTLCEDAKVFRAEAVRRVELHRQSQKLEDEGNRILIIGEDENEDKTKGLEDILYKADDEITLIDDKQTDQIVAKVLGPLGPQDDEDDEERLQKNRSSIILRWSIAARIGAPKNNFFLTGGDAEVGIWRALWEKYEQDPEPLRYDILQTPHHCSWHSLSEDSWKDSDNPKVDQSAKNALSQCFSKAIIVASSNSIKDDKNDPPCWGAKTEYLSIVSEVKGTFLCTSEEPNEDQPEPIEIILTTSGPKKGAKVADRSSVSSAAIASASTPRPHGT